MTETDNDQEFGREGTREIEGLTLPLLPLTTGVVLPQMVVTLAVESPEARDAADGALGG